MLEKKSARLFKKGSKQLQFINIVSDIIHEVTISEKHTEGK